jgi:hypothetical protein
MPVLPVLLIAKTEPPEVSRNAYRRKSELLSAVFGDASDDFQDFAAYPRNILILLQLLGEMAVMTDVSILVRHPAEGIKRYCEKFRGGVRKLVVFGRVFAQYYLTRNKSLIYILTGLSYWIGLKWL